MIPQTARKPVKKNKVVITGLSFLKKEWWKMRIGYICVSKSDGSQVLDLQHDAMIDAGINPERIYKDLSSGRKDDLPDLRDCLKALQPDSTLVVWKLDRLGKDL